MRYEHACRAFFSTIEALETLDELSREGSEWRAWAVENIGGEHVRVWLRREIHKKGRVV